MPRSPSAKRAFFPSLMSFAWSAGLDVHVETRHGNRSRTHYGRWLRTRWKSQCLRGVYVARGQRSHTDALVVPPSVRIHVMPARENRHAVSSEAATSYLTHRCDNIKLRVFLSLIDRTAAIAPMCARSIRVRMIVHNIILFVIFPRTTTTRRVNKNNLHTKYTKSSALWGEKKWYKHTLTAWPCKNVCPSHSLEGRIGFVVKVPNSPKVFIVFYCTDGFSSFFYLFFPCRHTPTATLIMTIRNNVRFCYHYVSFLSFRAL